MEKPRSQARALALQALCLFDALGDDFIEQLDSFVRDTVNHADLEWRPPIAPSAITFARRIAEATWRRRERYDELLRRYVPDWSIQRMQPVDRNILRLGLYEILEEPEVPAAVVLNEAIELARHFGGTDSSAFVNGVLDGVRRELDRAAAPAPEPCE